MVVPHATAHGLDIIRLVAPTTDDARLPIVLAGSSGFVYYVSITGITGTRSATADSLAAALPRIRRATDLPVAIGFGVRTPDQAGRGRPRRRRRRRRLRPDGHARQQPRRRGPGRARHRRARPRPDPRPRRGRPAARGVPRMSLAGTNTSGRVSGRCSRAARCRTISGSSAPTASRCCSPATSSAPSRSARTAATTCAPPPPSASPTPSTPPMSGSPGPIRIELPARPAGPARLPRQQALRRPPQGGPRQDRPRRRDPGRPRHHPRPTRRRRRHGVRVHGRQHGRRGRRGHRRRGPPRRAAARAADHLHRLRRRPHVRGRRSA